MSGPASPASPACPALAPPPIAAFVAHARSQRARRRRLGAAACLASLLLLVLDGCATYHPRALPAAPDTSTSLRSLNVDPATLALPRLAEQRIDLGRALPIDAVAALAVLNNPRLRLARDRLGIAQAQAFAAGLLPDPQFSTSRAYPGHSAGASSDAFDAGLDFDLGSLLTRPAAQAAARQHVREVNLQLLWMEWQTAAQAQLTYVRLRDLQARRALLLEEMALVEGSLRRSRAAVASGDLSRSDVDAQLLRLQSLRRLLESDDRSRIELSSQLHALLGLAPGVALHLARLPRIAPGAAVQARAALAHLGDIRPDLRALRAGYASQEESLREAVLSQFPSISIGLTRARDTTDVNTVGFGVSFRLPLFEDSRGRIAVARATRGELRDAYQLRLDKTRADVERVLARLALLRRQRAALTTAMVPLRAAAAAARQALGDGSYTLQQAQAPQLAVLDQRLALLDVARQQAEQAVTLDLLTGTGLYARAAPAAPAPPSNAQVPRS